jgi:hypothetical protein
MKENELPLVPVQEDSERTIDERTSKVKSVRKWLLRAIIAISVFPGSCIGLGTLASCCYGSIARDRSLGVSRPLDWYSNPENGDFHKRNEEITLAFMQEFPRMLATTEPDARTVFKRRFAYRGTEFVVRYYFQSHEDSSLSIPYEVLGPENDFQYRFSGSIEIPATKTEL